MLRHVPRRTFPSHDSDGRSSGARMRQTIRKAWKAVALLGVVLAAGTVARAIDIPIIQPLDPTITDLRLRALQRTSSLKAVVVFDPPNFGDFITDRVALRRLGKALFWDQQLGSDGQACASCHFHAGADNRSKNQINPGFRNQSPQFPGGDSTFGNSPLPNVASPSFGPNYQLTLADFPLHKLSSPADQHSPVISDTNDVISSQGVFAANFVAVDTPRDKGQGTPGGPFDVNGTLVRAVPPRNTPSAVNAVFNYRNFWDARARNEFNGVDPIGQLDPGAQVVKATRDAQGNLASIDLTAISIPSCSAGSQADGPPLSNLEMSYAGRRFQDLGRKMLGGTTTPLGGQLVALDDSLLGALSAQRLGPSMPGITTRYADLVKLAFLPAWWSAPGWAVDLSSGQPVLVQNDPIGPDQFSMMEYNFSLFFGLAVNEYERTLLANDSPFDRYLEGDVNALDDHQKAGLDLFLVKGRCIDCHSGPVLTGASIVEADAASQRTDVLVNPPNLERMMMADGGVAVYDGGHYNIGVRPTLEDIGVGGTIGPKNLPLANTRLFGDCVAASVTVPSTDPTYDFAVRQANATCGVPRIRARPLEAAAFLTMAWQQVGQPGDVGALIASAVTLLIGGDIPTNWTQANQELVQARELLRTNPQMTPAIAVNLTNATWVLPDPVNPGPNPLAPLGPPLAPGERTAVNGTFKTPGLRNVELTAPYFHNGGQGTLDQVVEFYDRGGDFFDQNIADFGILVRPIGFTQQEKADLVAFLRSLTDERVRYERAPFDHPSLSIPNGATPGGSPIAAVPFLDIATMEDRVTLPAVGALGSPIPLGSPGTPLASFPDPLWSSIGPEVGDGQKADPGAALSRPLTVRVTDASGNPVAGVKVSFDGPVGAVVTPAVAVTGADGRASAQATLSAAAGAQTFTASSYAVAGSPVTFTAEAVGRAAASGGSSAPASGAVSSPPTSGGDAGPFPPKSGGCGSGPGGALALLMAAAALAARPP
jgi:cytochrome c peroxidase